MDEKGGVVMSSEIGYDSGLVLLSILIAMLSAYTAFDMASRVRNSGPSNKSFSRWWLFGAAAAMGIGIWAMHFVGILAYQLPIDVTYKPGIFFLSIISPIIFSWGAFWLVTSQVKTYKVMALASFGLAIGIISMHYLGMAALKVERQFHYHGWSIIVASFVAYGTSWASLTLFHFFGHVDHLKFISYKLSCGIVMGVAISATHYIGMYGTDLMDLGVLDSNESNSTMGYILIVGMVLLYGMVLISAFLDRKRANDSLHIQRELEKFESLFTHNNDAVLLLNEEGILMKNNPIAVQVFGYDAKDLTSMRIFDLVGEPNDIEEMIESAKKGYRDKRELQIIAKSGEVIDVTIKILPLILQGQFEGVYCIIENISELKKREREISSLHSAIEATAEGIAIITNEGDFNYLNKAFASLYGYDNTDQLIGENWSSISDISEFNEIRQKIVYELSEKESWQGEWFAQGINEEKTPIRISITRLQDKNFICTVSNITESKHLEWKLRKANEQLTFLSNTDELTAISNRRSFLADLKQAWEKAREDKSMLSVLMLDVDSFKEFNDTYGHQKGDDILRFISHTLNEFWKSSGLLFARYGGEEFIALVPELDVDLAWEIAEEARAHVESYRIPHENSPYGILTISIGVATTCPNNLLSAEELIEQADLALYRAKTDGRNRVEN